MSLTLLQEVPKCLEDRIYTKFRMFSIKTSDGKDFCYTFNYCKKCKQYITRKGMEKDIKRVALYFVQTFNPSYKLSDIVEINILK